MAARSAAGDIVYYPLSANTHGGGILRYGIAPYANRALERPARIYLKRVHDALDYVGVLTIEFFVVEGRLIANEMAPASPQLRPLDHRRLRDQPIRESSARDLRSAARAARGRWDTPP